MAGLTILQEKYLHFMSLVSHKKSYLLCVELTNFRIFTKPIPIFFQSIKLRQPTEGRGSCLKINKYYVIFVNSTIQHIPNSFSYEKPGTLIMIFLSGQVHSSSFVDCRPGRCATKTKSLQDSFIALIFFAI